MRAKVSKKRVMTSLHDTVLVTSDKYSNNLFKSRNSVFQKSKPKHVFKSKENTYNIRCDKALKRKLKKYKLRHDGKEDQDVIDVSNFFVTSLYIKSPNNKEQHLNNIEDIEIIRPKNYLFKMGRQSSKNKEKKSGNKSREKPPKEEKIIKEFSSPQNDSQSRKQTNAFQLLMDSRNKVIGSNSPGKQKCLEDVEISNVEEKKELKTKRKLLLQNMVEAKGALQKIEMEELQAKHIKRKMEKRAQKLKAMLLNNKKKKNNKLSDNGEDVKLVENNKSPEVKITKGRKLNTLQLVNIFNECEIEMKISPEKKHLPKEDEDFLKKLSPSLKKKENMLSYFKKVEKETELESANLVFKVKLKTKKNIKRKMNANNKNETFIEALSGHDNEITRPNAADEKKYNDLEQKENEKKLFPPGKKNEPVLANKDRPKRSIKRPVKYVDDLFLSSSDEEWNIFTPKKKRTNSMPPKSNILNDDIKILPSLTEKLKNVAKYKKIETQNKPVKLAPIFANKTPPSLADIEARQKFLQSGVPEQLKKKSLKQDTSGSVNTCFPVTVHIKQNKADSEMFPKTCYNIPLIDINYVNIILPHSIDLFKSLINLYKAELPVNISVPIQDVNAMLKAIKCLNQRFPVYRTYRLLKDKSQGEMKEHSDLELDNSLEIMNSFADFGNENPEQLNWTSKYKPTSSKQILGNFESMKELRKWLVQWTENEAKKKMNNKDSDFSDFYQSDTDSRESMKATNNLLIITGPVGCGKTSGVYAVAAELAIKVLEVNASSKRTGKIMLQDLHEATQSHKVDRGTHSAENSQKSQDSISQSRNKTKKRGRPKKLKDNFQPSSDTKPETFSGPQCSQENSRTAMSLILIDDADIVFEQDDGFCSAIVQLVQHSKRPVILITSTLSCLHLQRFLQIGKTIKMNPLLPNMLGTWLDILCLVNNGICWPGLGAKFLDKFKGDVRKTVNYLQFCTQTDNSNDDQVIKSQEIINNQEDEKSNMSWADNIDTAESNDTLDSNLNQIWKFFTDKMFDLAKTEHYIPLFDVWWNIPKLLTNKIAPTNMNSLPTDSCMLKGNVKELELLANSVDAISIADTFSFKERRNDTCLTSPPWFTAEMHSVSEEDNIDNYTRCYELSAEISSEYVRDNILLAIKNKESKNQTTMFLDFPGFRMYREKDRIVSRHNNLNDCLNPSAALDKRALALDYWSSCRTICRIERTKTDSNSKRNNRFCHYLKSMNANLKSSSFDNLADSLCVKGTE